ncbi:hypothetical protein [Marinobacter sp.]|uniref:hypothetical protein n=1 Tax=Marinobacter sp. TaxID=50741 RepID=UPI00384B8505
MEPIRPDDDELRAERRPASSAPAGQPKAEKTGPDGPDQGGGKGKGRRPPGGGARHGLVYVLLVVVAIAGLGAWYQQQQRISAMAQELEETEDWMRQSKLALARFEGDLSETGETIDNRGSTLEQRLEAQKEQIATANSEIRKLWVIAYEKNRPLLEKHTSLLEAQGKQLAALQQTQEAQSTELTTLAGSLSEQNQRLSGMAEATARYESEFEQLKSRDAELAARAESLAESLDSVKQEVERRLQRFVQEQKLASGGLEGRVSALERELQDLEAAQRKLNQAEQRLNRVEGAIEAIDSARAQLTSRLVRLSEQVDQLRQAR